MAKPEIYTLVSGRRVALQRLAQGCHPVVFCHSAPGAGTFDPDPRESAAQSVTLLALDRPGYGTSDPVYQYEWATPAKAADDIAEILDRLGIRSVGAAGWSAGGRVALALAARRPDLVDRAVVFSTPAPDEEVPWIPPEHKAGMAACADCPLPRFMPGWVKCSPQCALPTLMAPMHWRRLVQALPTLPWPFQARGGG